MSLDEIRAREQAATEGPWEWDGNDIDQCGTRWGSVVENTVSCMSYCYGGSVEQEVKLADREFVAHARTDIPRLLAALDATLDLCTDLDDNEHEHVERCEGEPTCPACWARSIRKTVTDALA